MSIQIMCVNKANGNHSDPHEGITNFGWYEESTKTRGNFSRPEIVAWIEKGGEAFTMPLLSNKKAILKVRISLAGRKFVQTCADGVWNNNLLSLAECRL